MSNLHKLLIINESFNSQTLQQHDLVITNIPISLALHTWVSQSPCHAPNLVRDESEIVEVSQLTLILLPPKQILVPHKTLAQMKKA